jgi:hypothetical protein
LASNELSEKGTQLFFQGWHFVVRPDADHQVSSFFRWLTHTHTMRWHASHHTVGTGHLYQGRFKAFPIEEDDLDHVNQPQTTGEVEAIRKSIARGMPFGNDRWVSQTAARLEIKHTLRPRGRPAAK